MPYGKFKMGKDDKKKKPPFAKEPGRKTIMPVKPGKPGRGKKPGDGWKTIMPVPKKRG